MTAEPTCEIELTRWYLLRIWPRVWRDTLREVGVSPWRPAALWLFVLGCWSFLSATRAP